MVGQLNGGQRGKVSCLYLQTEGGILRSHLEAGKIQFWGHPDLVFSNRIISENREQHHGHRVKTSWFKSSFSKLKIIGRINLFLFDNHHIIYIYLYSSIFAQQGRLPPLVLCWFRLDSSRLSEHVCDEKCPPHLDPPQNSPQSVFKKGGFSWLSLDMLH